jgi:hypothetical protein
VGNKKAGVLKLNDKDKKIIIKNSNICTDSHGKNCNVVNSNEQNKKLN